MSVALAEFTERLVPISDFSQGKAGRIFSDVMENNNEYIVLKNNQPIAVVISVSEYRDTQHKVARFEKLMELIENYRLLNIAESRKESETLDFEELISSEGFDIEDLRKHMDEVEFE